MSRPEHSPWPWRSLVDARPLHSPVLIIDANGVPVATVNQATDCDTENANAALLIAAPDLLAFVQRIAEDPCDCTPNLDSMENEPCEVCCARSLVRYAESGTPLPGEDAAAEQERIHDGYEPG